MSDIPINYNQEEFEITENSLKLWQIAVSSYTSQISTFWSGKKKCIQKSKNMQKMVEEKNYGESRITIDLIFLCYTFMMEKVPSEWDNWAQILQQNHLTGLFSFLILKYLH